MTKRLFIGRLPNSAREEDIEHFFRNSGRIHDISLKNGYGFVEFDDDRDADDAVYDLNGKSLCGERIVLEHARGPNRGRDRGGDRGYGGGRGYDRDRGGGYDRDRGGGYDRGGDRGYSSRSSSSRQPGWIDNRYGPPTRTDHRVTVENLSSRVSWQDLKDYMRQAGEVRYADAHKDRKNEGVVEFASRTDMKNAISKLDNTEINGRRIRIVEESKSSRRSYSRSRSRSRSRSPRDRSKSASRGKSASHSRSRSASRSNSRSRSRSKDD